MADSPTGFSWPFLESMSRWTLGIGILAAVVGGILLKSPVFAAAVMAGVLADVAIVRTTVHRAMKAEVEHTVAPAVAGLFVGVRLAIKAVILVVAYLAGNPELFWGAVLGVVLFDTVLLTVGSVKAASTMFQTKER
jgi:uncharacterized membrane protein AbrB (regulator of aidB expression)